MIPKKILEQIEIIIEMMKQSQAKKTEKHLLAYYALMVFNVKLNTGMLLTHLATHLGYHLGQINYHPLLQEAEK